MPLFKSEMHEYEHAEVAESDPEAQGEPETPQPTREALEGAHGPEDEPRAAPDDLSDEKYVAYVRDRRAHVDVVDAPDEFRGVTLDPRAFPLRRGRV